MKNLEEAKEIMHAAGCVKAYSVYDFQLNDIAEVKNCDEEGGSIELERDITQLKQNFLKEMVLNTDKPIICPINPSLNKYLKFSINDKTISTSNLNPKEYFTIQNKINSLLKKYNWLIKKN